MRHHITAALATALILTATACTSDSSGSDDKPPATRNSLSAKWGPKIEDAANADKAICNEVGDQACAEHLTDIAMAITDVDQAINEAGGSGSYPRSAKQVNEIDDAVAAYTKHECLGDENAGIADSPCPDDARTIMTGAAALPLALEADEAKAG